MEQITFWLRKLSLVRDRITIEHIIDEACRSLINADATQILYFDELDTITLKGVKTLLHNTNNTSSFHENTSAIDCSIIKIKPPFWVIPFRTDEPIGVLFCTCNNQNTPGISEIQIIVESAVIALENVSVHEQLARLVAERTTELAEARKEAESKSQMKSRFLSATSHDLRQPLQQITSLINILTRQQTSPEGIKHLSRMKNIVLGMERLLNRLLNLNELEEGKIKPRLSDVSLQSLFQKLEEDFKQQASDKSLQLSFKATNAIVHTDPDLLLQMLRNIIGNALKYTNAGFVAVSCEQEDDFVEINIEDSGPGINSELQDQIFEPFFQIKDARQQSASFGLGLAFVKVIAEILCHPVSLYSDGIKGTRFSIQVPVNKTELLVLIEQAPPLIQTESTTRGLILYLEDDEVLAESISILLEMEKFEVITADSLALAQNLLKSLQLTPDIIVTDLNLRGCENGLDIIQQIRRDTNRNIPAILLTGYTELEIQQKALEVVQKVLNKPIDADELVREIENLQNKRI